jgi:uncharacterized protein YndB with AHSA1/START domain
MLAKPSITLKRHIKAPPAKVFAAWTQATQLARWFGPHETRPDTLKAELDVRVGGKFRVSFDAIDGEYHEVGGTYREVVPDQRLQFTWAWHSTPERESLLTISLKPDGAGTLLTLLHEQFFDEAARDGHEKGWTDLLGKLEQSLA